jgi:hypothetical protein
MKINSYILKICFTLLIGFFIQLNTAMAQGGSKKEALEAIKVGIITKKLELTPDEAKVFWPIYNLYEDELSAIRKKRKEEKNTDDITSLNDKEIEKIVDGEILFRQQELDIIKKYHAQFKKILSVKKVALLYKAQDEYKKELLKQIQEKGKK